jgi:hypothetical protein
MFVALYCMSNNHALSAVPFMHAAVMLLLRSNLMRVQFGLYAHAASYLMYLAYTRVTTSRYGSIRPVDDHATEFHGASVQTYFAVFLRYIAHAS